MDELIGMLGRKLVVGMLGRELIGQLGGGLICVLVDKLVVELGTVDNTLHCS